MALNIKNENVHRLAREAARRSGLSQTSAIEAALTAYLGAMDDRESDRDAELLSLLADFDEQLDEAGREAIRATDLYDERTGLPR